MITESTASGSPQRKAYAKSLRGKRSAEFIEPLRLIARQHEVCYEIWPVWSNSQGVQKEVGFELLLCGVNGHVIQEGGALHGVSWCQHCARTFDELREIAEWVLLLKKPPTGSEIYSFDHALHLAPPNRQHRHEIILTTIVLRQECLKEVRERLLMLGIREDVWYAQASASA
jgi:hypothetical protein